MTGFYDKLQADEKDLVDRVTTLDYRRAEKLKAWATPEKLFTDSQREARAQLLTGNPGMKTKLEKILQEQSPENFEAYVRGREAAKHER